MRRVTVLVALLCLGALGVRFGVRAADYSVAFSNATDGVGTVNLANPLPVVYTVTSKFSQPRNTGPGTTNPHNGTDLGSPYGTAVYAIWDAWVTSADPSRYEMFLYLDLNNDGVRNDNAYVKYDHLSRILVSSGRVSKGTRIADSGNEGGRFASHLHFGLRKDLNADGVSDVWIPSEPYYRTVAGWDYGKMLDFVASSAYSGNTATVTCYGHAGGGKDSIAAGDVVIFHRRAGASTWTPSAAAKAEDRFSLSFSGRYAPGTSIQWMARCTRTSIKGVASLSWAFHPPKFYQPDLDPNATPLRFDFFTNTVQ